MEEVDYKGVCEIFQGYGGIPDFNFEHDNIELNWFGTAMSRHTAMSMPTSVKMNIVFSSSRGFKEFLNDITRLDRMLDEEYLRQQNPSLQRAWEEYQIILKLTR